MAIDIFDRIAGRYDRVNAILSLGMHHRWRQVFLKYLPSEKELSVLDIATGTGDVPLVLSTDPKVVNIVGIDVSENMLDIARQKIKQRGLMGRIQFLKNDASALPLAGSSVDVVSVAFGLRNFSDLMNSLSEAYRVLSVGGVFLAMEFAIPAGVLERFFFRFYVGCVIPFLGGLLTGDWKAYFYLSRSILSFPYGERMQQIICQVGFRDVSCRKIAMGAVNVYIARK